jgi:hypothetical protein
VEKMKLLNEDQLLDKEFRIKVIKEIQSDVNRARKNEMRKRHEVYKDNTVKYVMLKLKREIKKDETLVLMENRASNISIAKKIINKLGRVYSGGEVKRETGKTLTDIQVTELAKLMNFDQKQKKADRFARLFKNCLAWIYPDEVRPGEYRLCQKIFAPWQYDVLENPNEPEEASAIILSDYVDQSVLALHLAGGPQVSQLEGESIAVSSDASKHCETFIWWSNKYHFTTDDKGVVIGIGKLTPPDLLNPIGVIPGITIAEDQDGSYWADGGQDLVDGSILVNTIITDMNAITFMQGWGQMVITGTHVPEEYNVGPHHALVLRHDPKKDEAAPTVTMVTANPPLADWRASVEQYVALLLSTNNLSPATVAAKLDATNFASGIAMLIDRSESTDSIQDKQTEFYWIEMKEWEVIKRWHNLFYDRKILTKDFADVGRLPEDLRVTPKFSDDTSEIMPQSEKLDNMKKRKELGIVTQLDLIMKDNPGLTKEEAEKKLQEIETSATKVVADSVNDTDPNQKPIHRQINKKKIQADQEVED